MSDTFKMYHGTTIQAAVDIMKNGFKTDTSNWNVSDPDMVYFVNPIKVQEDANEEEESWITSESMRLANEEGQIANALLPYSLPVTCVLEFIFENGNDYYCFEDDNSCEGMYFASQIELDEINRMIKDKKVKIIPYYFLFYSKLSLFYLINLQNNPTAALKDKLSINDYEALTLIGEVKMYLDNITELNELSFEQAKSLLNTYYPINILNI